MPTQKIFLRQLMMGVGVRETSYNAGLNTWTSPTATSFTQYDEASVQQWNDNIQDDADMITGYEGVTHQEIARQSVTMTYTETRAKPHSVAAMLGLAFGTIVGTQDGVLAAYRQRVSPGTTLALPSIAIQAKQEGGVQYKYTGFKANMVELGMSQADPYLRLSAELVGSGSRVTAVDAFPAALEENWLRQGNARLYLKATGGTPITLPTTPSQTAANLGGAEVDFSSRVLAWSLRWNNNIPVDFGYRPGGGDIRSILDPTRRGGTITLRIQVDTADEATWLNYYINQSPLALELNLKMTTLLAAGGAMFPGVILLIPQAQFRPITRANTNQLEDFQIEARVFEDKTNPMITGFIYSPQGVYLA